MAQTTEPEFVFDPGDLTLGDLIDLEDHFGITLQALMEATNGQQLERLGAKLLAALAFIALRQRNGDATPDEAKRVKVTELVKMVGGKKRLDAAVKAQGRLATGAKGGRREDPPPGV
jgi:hypothetical protein